MALSEEQLTNLFYTAVDMLQRKLSHIPTRVFASGRKPTISDILNNNQEAFYLVNIPPELQIDFVFENYEHFVKARFRVNKKTSNMTINKAIFYWQMDNTHSFCRSHIRVAYNILTACVIRASPYANQYVDKEAYEFCDALIRAWVASVTQQDDFESQAEFLELWANGPYDLMHFGRKAKDHMGKAVKPLKQYVPKRNRAGGLPFWDDMYYTSPNMRAKFGTSWVIQYIVEMEDAGKGINEEGKKMEAEAALANGSLLTGFGGMGLELGQLTEEMFAQPLVQALLREYDKEMEEESAQEKTDRIPDEDEMWMDPDEAIAMLKSTSDKYESMKTHFSRAEW